jgi:hypothetical protein
VCARARHMRAFVGLTQRERGRKFEREGGRREEQRGTLGQSEGEREREREEREREERERRESESESESESDSYLDDIRFVDAESGHLEELAPCLCRCKCTYTYTYACVFVAVQCTYTADVCVNVKCTYTYTHMHMYICMYDLQELATCLCCCRHVGPCVKELGFRVYSLGGWQRVFVAVGVHPLASESR